jgi:ribonuclease Z
VIIVGLVKRDKLPDIKTDNQALIIFMRPSFHPRLVNDPFSDPGLYVPFLFEKRALLFDLGDLSALSPGDLLKVDYVFVSHTHMDHFVGFDALLRLFLGRDKTLEIFGPPDFFKQIEGKLAGYTWNLVDEYEADFTLKATEIHEGKSLSRNYRCRDRFYFRGEEEKEFDGILLKEPSFYIEAVLLDHRIPCLGFSLKENFYVNIMKDGLQKLDLEAGPWLNRFKKALYDGTRPDSVFKVAWEQGGRVVREERFVLGKLAAEIAKISPGQKITYITDVSGSPDNQEKILRLANDSDHLFIEAAFLDCDRATADRKYHLTAGDAGALAKKAGAKQLTVFHFSPRYLQTPGLVLEEAMAAFRA